MVALERAVEAGQIDPALRELINIRVSQLNGCGYCLTKHTAAARQLGESCERLDALSEWRSSDAFDERERAALELAEELTTLADHPPRPPRVQRHCLNPRHSRR